MYTVIKSLYMLDHDVQTIHLSNAFLNTNISLMSSLIGVTDRTVS